MGMTKRALIKSAAGTELDCFIGVESFKLEGSMLVLSFQDGIAIVNILPGWTVVITDEEE